MSQKLRAVQGPALEEYFSTVESDTNWIIEKLVCAARQRVDPQLGPSEFETWTRFFIYQQKRVPDFFKAVSDNEVTPERIDAIIGEYEAAVGPVPAEIREQFKSPEFVERFKQNSLVAAIRDPSPMVEQALRRKGLAIAVIIRDTQSFILGSSPMARLGVRNGSSLDNPEVELWLPVARDVAVAPYGSPGEIRIEGIGGQHVRRINQTIFAQSTIVASGSKQLVESLLVPR
ncbi:hypothetical protein [Microvirga yunnanensis]|uniref:hypothetical protein n=1 Tax=Microvirga yunnanensis TaxID=2953740 RepID=UPI0021C7F0B4|nr:hypothetical protein [Microvirga sp. HBU65207]